MEDLLGKKIENYEIISVLGHGGMGKVFKARDEKLDRFVAIKILSVKAVDKEKFIERFKREAKNHAQLLHPNIVTVYGFIEYQGLLGIVMEYVDGESLEKVIFRNNRLHVYDVVYIIKQVLQGIGYAHSAQRQISRSQSFGHYHNIWCNAMMVNTKHFARSSKTAHRFVINE